MPKHVIVLIIAIAVTFRAHCANAQENMDGLTFREVFFVVLFNEQLLGQSDVAVSPDGNDVYVALFNSGGIYHFRRSTEGTLSPVAFTPVVDAALVPIPVGELVVSHSGRFVYATLRRGEPKRVGAIARFNRDASTGALSLNDVYPGLDQILPGLHAPAYLELAPNDRGLYVLNGDDGLTSGDLSFLSLDDQGEVSLVQRASLPDTGNGIGFTDMAIAPDGRNIYLCSGIGISNYDRASDGSIAFDSTLPAGSGRGFFSVAVSSDGDSLYAAGTALFHFARDPQGDLTELDAIGDVSGEPEFFGNFSNVLVSQDGERVYTTSRLGVNQVIAFERDRATGDLSLLERLVDGIANFEILNLISAVVVSPDDHNLYIAARETLSVFETERPDLPCREADEIADEYAALVNDFALTDDIDQDGLPETASLALMEEASCGNVSDGFDEATTNAYLINVASVNGDNNVYESGELVGYQRAVASLIATSEAMRIYFNNEMRTFGVALSDFYVTVNCVDGSCEPANARAHSGRAADEPFSGGGDPDEDGFTNAEEWANVVARGGDERDFADSALDPSNDGTMRTSSGGGGGGCFIATAAYGTPLAAELDSLRSLRDTRLLTNPLGAAFVDAYYRLSPPAANFIAERPAWRSVARFGIESLVNRYAMPMASGVLGVLLVLIAQRFRKTARHK